MGSLTASNPNDVDIDSDNCSEDGNDDSTSKSSLDDEGVPVDVVESSSEDEKEVVVDDGSDVIFVRQVSVERIEPVLRSGNVTAVEQLSRPVFKMANLF